MKINSLTKLGTCILFTAFFFEAFSQSEGESATAQIERHRKNQFETFQGDASPLGKSDKRKFKGLNYYSIDLEYRVHAKFMKTENPVLFKMKTTTSRLPDYIKYGEVHFSIMGTEYKLEVYQSPDIVKRPGYEDYLFIPFTDKTNGHETYEVGRYLEFRIPESDDVVIDFNLCYNPYCAYSPNYSCPIPPEVNELPIEIRAGEKKFKSH